MSVPTPPGLECLLDLACRDGVDIRPTLLRVLTDLYVQKPLHTAEEEHHYVELAQRLIQTVDTKTRAAVSARLRDYQKIPTSLLPHLTPPSPMSDMPGTAAPAPLPQAAKPAVLAPAEAPALVPERFATTPAAAQPARPKPAVELCELFFAAPPADRRLILLNLDAVAEPGGDADAGIALSGKPAATIRALEMAALRRDRRGFAREIVRSMNIDIRMAMRIVDDATGEPLLIPARLLDMPENVLQRVLLFLNPVVGRSVQRVFELSALYEQFTIAAARHMTLILQAASPAADPRPARYDAALWPETNARLSGTARSQPSGRTERLPDFADLPSRIGER
jgi:hypothetical protein